MLKQLHEADGIADAVTFVLTPDVDDSGAGGQDWACVDEDNCNEEAYTLCAGVDGIGGSLDFLSCMDKQDGDADKGMAKARTCAGDDWEKLTKCAFGPEGKKLLELADARGRQHFHLFVPHMEYNGHGLWFWQTSYSSLLSRICSTPGVKAGACKSALMLV